MEELEKAMELAQKKDKIAMLVFRARKPFIFQYFDFESNENLDKKLDVLERLIAGEEIDVIDGFWDILELYPKENEET